MELRPAEALFPMAESMLRILPALTRPLVPATANAVILPRARQDTIGAHLKNGSRVARSSSDAETRLDGAITSDRDTLTTPPTRATIPP